MKLLTENIIASYLGRIRSNLRGILIFLMVLALYLVLAGPYVESFVSTKALAFTQSISSDFRNSLSKVVLNSSQSQLDQRSTLLLQNDLAQIASNTALSTSDPRVLAMQKFLVDYHSPMYPYAEVFVDEAEETGLDWRLVASISGVESAFGNLIPFRSNNAWGWRGGPNGEYSNFTSWKEGISTVTQRLATGYGTTLTPFQIEPTYCPPCGANPAHAWANGVTKFMQELQFYLENLESL
jgi:ABC-type multidrug transport system fused ATPase/permease subunit